MNPEPDTAHCSVFCREEWEGFIAVEAASIAACYLRALAGRGQRAERRNVRQRTLRRPDRPAKAREKSFDVLDLLAHLFDQDFQLHGALAGFAGQ